MIGRILAMAWVEALRLMRTPAAFTLILAVPAFQVVLFGYAIRPLSAEVRVAIAAPAPDAGAGAATRLRAEPGVRVMGGVLPPGGAAQAVREGGADIAVEIPEVRSFSNPFAPIRPLRLIVDATNPALTEAVVARLTAGYWQDAAQRGDVGAPPLVVERLNNPDARSDWPFLAGLIGVTVMISMVMLGCLSLARECEGGTWEALMTLPASRFELLAGKALPYVVIGTVQGLSVLGIGAALFALPLRGAILALCGLLPLFAGVHFLIGYAISARARTQIAALQGAVAFYLPAMLLSGFLYPFETLPLWAQRVSTVFPLTHFVAAARDVLIRGAGAPAVLAALWPMLAAASGIGALALWAGSRRID
jgi:ABC-2 type transport system permease protein